MQGLDAKADRGQHVLLLGRRLGRSRLVWDGAPKHVPGDEGVQMQGHEVGPQLQGGSLLQLSHGARCVCHVDDDALNGGQMDER